MVDTAKGKSSKSSSEDEENVRIENKTNKIQRKKSLSSSNESNESDVDKKSSRSSSAETRTVSIVVSGESVDKRVVTMPSVVGHTTFQNTVEKDSYTIPKYNYGYDRRSSSVVRKESFASQARNMP